MGERPAASAGPSRSGPGRGPVSGRPGARMLLTVDAQMTDSPGSMLTTVQNDWRAPGGDVHEWLDRIPEPEGVWHSRRSSRPTHSAQAAPANTSLL